MVFFFKLRKKIYIKMSIAYILIKAYSQEKKITVIFRLCYILSIKLYII